MTDCSYRNTFYINTEKCRMASESYQSSNTGMDFDVTPKPCNTLIKNVKSRKP